MWSGSTTSGSKGHLDRVVRGTVEETLNSLLDAEADRLSNAQRCERTDSRRRPNLPVSSIRLCTGAQHSLCIEPWWGTKDAVAPYIFARSVARDIDSVYYIRPTCNKYQGCHNYC